jgi:hypothetical protein
LSDFLQTHPVTLQETFQREAHFDVVLSAERSVAKVEDGLVAILRGIHINWNKGLTRDTYDSIEVPKFFLN